MTDAKTTDERLVLHGSFTSSSTYKPMLFLALSGLPFSFRTDAITTPQIRCGITYTTAETHRIIAERLSESAVYGGRVSGKGPRLSVTMSVEIVSAATAPPS